MFSDVSLHVLYKIANAAIHPFPFPHIFVRDVFPKDFYEGMRANQFGGFHRVATMPYLPNSLFAFVKTDNSFHGVEPITEVAVRRDLLLYDIKAGAAPELSRADPAAPSGAATPVKNSF